MRNFRVFGFFIVAALAILGCSNPTSSTEYKSLKSEVDSIFVEVRSLQTEIDSLQTEVDSADSLAIKLEDLKTERATLIGDLATLLSLPSRRSAAISKFSLPACKTFTYAELDLRGKYDDNILIEVKKLIDAKDYRWSILQNVEDGFPAAINQFITDFNFNKCNDTNVQSWLKEKCESFDRLMLKKDTNSYIGKCLKGTVEIYKSDATTGPCAFRGYISGDYKVKAQFGVTLDATNHFAVTDCSSTAKNMTEGRTVTFFGFVVGTYTYTDGSQAIPAFKVIAGSK